MQLSAGQCSCVMIFLSFLVKSIEMSLSICFLSTFPIFRTSTGSSFIETIVSPDCNPIFAPNISVAVFSIFAGVDTKSPLMNHSWCKKFTVGIR